MAYSTLRLRPSSNTNEHGRKVSFILSAALSLSKGLPKDAEC